MPPVSKIYPELKSDYTTASFLNSATKKGRSNDLPFFVANEHMQLLVTLHLTHLFTQTALGLFLFALAFYARFLVKLAPFHLAEKTLLLQLTLQDADRFFHVIVHYLYFQCTSPRFRHTILLLFHCVDATDYMIGLKLSIEPRSKKSTLSSQCRFTASEIL